MKSPRLIRIPVLLGLLAVVFLLSCKGTKQAAHSGEPVSTDPDSLFAAIERTPCFGRCPTYVISIYKSGYVVYEGRQFVENIGFFYTFISKKQLDGISAMADKTGFAGMKDAYHDPNIVDVPSTFTTCRVNGKLKRIDNTFGEPPQGLLDFESFLDNMFTGTKWTRIPGSIRE